MKWSKDTIKKAMHLYAVTDRSHLINQTLHEAVEKAMDGGITFLQLREKEIPYEEFLALAKDLGSLAKEKGIPFVINDDLKVTLASQADGIHIGQEDGDPALIRKAIGWDRIMGVSVQTVAQAKKAEAQGADYLGVGAVFTTASKDNATAVSLDELKAICDNVSIPVVAIGGIQKDNIQQLAKTGIDGVSVISAIFSQKDCQKAAAEMSTLTHRIC